MPTRFICATALCCLLAVAPSASAECAWVVWYESKFWGTKMEGSSSWELFSAYPNYASCEAGLKAKVASMYHYYLDEDKAMPPNPERTSTVKLQGNIISTTYKWSSGEQLSGGHSMRYLCLTDTVDPRGPKGK